MNTPLVLQDGFPRSDIDVVKIRNIRINIIRIRNDLSLIISEIQKELVEYHKILQNCNKEIDTKLQIPSNMLDPHHLVISSKTKNSEDQVEEHGLSVIFAIVKSIVIGSPAHVAVRYIIFLQIFITE